MDTQLLVLLKSRQILRKKGIIHI